VLTRARIGRTIALLTNQRKTGASMAFISQDEKKVIAANLKKVIPDSWKYSLAVRDNRTIVLTITSASVDLLSIINSNRENPVAGSIDLNTYYLDAHFKGNKEMVELFEKIHTTMRGANWFDDSDSQTDYFHCKHYTDIKIGRWDKPFVYVAPARAQAFPYAAWKAE
jgi:hypothetical protein